jgi:hypothetical protein
MTKEYKTYRNSVLDRTYHKLLRACDDAEAQILRIECAALERY